MSVLLQLNEQSLREAVHRALCVNVRVEGAATWQQLEGGGNVRHNIKVSASTEVYGPRCVTTAASEETP